MDPEFLPCPCCGTITLAEVPPCADDHGGQCPDRACTDCGTALTVGARMVGEEARGPAGHAPRPVRSAA
jgi:hypothetical protein